ncbi:MAG: CoA ester lyase [Vicinamibacterales bacterium]|nr:CoA ester lyase [Vicinamibacterales bacterium]
MPQTRATTACRAHLFAPGSHERLLVKVFHAGADAVVLDLEDAVAPESKPDARRLVAATLAARAGVAGPVTAVRINGVDTPWWQDDLDAVIGPGLQLIRVPKAESARQIAAVDARVRSLELARGLEPGAIGIVATIESAAGVLAAADIARAPRVRGFTFGAADFVRDISADASGQDLATLYARQHLVVVSRALNLEPPVASVYTQITDLDGLRRTTEESRALGFFGRSCIHPTQVPVVQEVFTPTPADLAAARATVDAWDQAVSQGVGAFTMAGGQFVDDAIVRRARAVITLAEALKEKTSL